MNPYLKIAIKVVVVVVICAILQMAWIMLGHRMLARTKRNRTTQLEEQRKVETSLDDLLAFAPDLPAIRTVQLQDMQLIRNLVPEESEFQVTAYLRTIHGMLTAGKLDTDGIQIETTKEPPGKISFEEAFTSDPTELQAKLTDIMSALQMFRERKSEMSDFLTSMQFYQMLGTEGENYQAIASGVRTHSFRMAARGSYENIKKFTFEVFNMRPHTALVDFQMWPQGAGVGPSRQYACSFRLMTYGDANDPPPLWKAWKDGRAFDPNQPGVGREMGTEEQTGDTESSPEEGVEEQTE